MCAQRQLTPATATPPWVIDAPMARSPSKQHQAAATQPWVSKCALCPLGGPGDNNTAIGVDAGGSLGEFESNNIDIGFGVEAYQVIVTPSGSATRISPPPLSRESAEQRLSVARRYLWAQTATWVRQLPQSDLKRRSNRWTKRAKRSFHSNPLRSVTKRRLIRPVHQQFGLVAEDVEKISPDLVVRDENGVVNTVRYDQVNAMLLNEFLKEHKKVAEQQAAIAELKPTVAEQQKRFRSRKRESKLSQLISRK